MAVNNLEGLPGRGIRYATRIARRQFKGLRQSLGGYNTEKKQYLFVVGCQRSGTSMMYKVFEHDRDAGVYDEISVLSSNDKIEKLRLNSYKSVLSRMAKNPASLVVAKPLVESQNLTDLLKFFPESKAIWMFRPYKDVIQSNLRRFGRANGLTDIQPLLDNDTNNWRAENVDATTRNIILENVPESISETDAAALFWYVRNSLYFQQIDHFNNNVFLCNYDNLVSDPGSTIRQLYGFLERKFPGTSIQQGINSHSIGKGHSISLSGPVQELCEEMLHRLIQHQRN